MAAVAVSTGAVVAVASTEVAVVECDPTVAIAAAALLPIELAAHMADPAVTPLAVMGVPQGVTGAPLAVPAA